MSDVYQNLDDYIDYIARRFPGEFGQSIQGLLSNPPSSSPAGIKVAPGQPAPALAPAINIPTPGSSVPSTPSAHAAAATPIISGTKAPPPPDTASPNQGEARTGLEGLAQQLMAAAGKTTGLPFPDLAKLSPFTGDPQRPLPLNLPQFGGIKGPTGSA